MSPYLNSILFLRICPVTNPPHSEAPLVDSTDPSSASCQTRQQWCRRVMWIEQCKSFPNFKAVERLLKAHQLALNCSSPLNPLSTTLGVRSPKVNVIPFPSLAGSNELSGLQPWILLITNFVQLIGFPLKSWRRSFSTVSLLSSHPHTKQLRWSSV